MINTPHDLLASVHVIIHHHQEKNSELFNPNLHSFIFITTIMKFLMVISFFSLLPLVLSIPAASPAVAPVNSDPNSGHHGEVDESKFPANFHNEPDLDLSKTPKTPGAQLKKFRYGPYTVKGQGMISNRPVLNADVPCKNCYVTAIQVC